MHESNSTDNLIADLFSILSHLARKSEETIPIIVKILKGQNEYQLLVKYLSNGNGTIKAKCCNMLGNLMKHNDSFYDVLKKNKIMFECLIKCCQSEELNVRKVNQHLFFLKFSFEQLYFLN